MREVVLLRWICLLELLCGFVYEQEKISKRCARHVVVCMGKGR